MKLLTTVPPRRDGSFTVTGADGRKWPFVADAAGVLVGEVDDVALVAHLLKSGLYEPFDQADFSTAETLLTISNDDDEPDDEDDEDLDGAAPLPVEANTPPVRRKPGRPKKYA